MKRIIGIFILNLFLINAYSQKTITMTKEGGVYNIPCKVNGLNLKFIFDTGAANVSISLTEAIFMIKNDYLKSSDIFGNTYAKLANGDITENTEILLREIEIGDFKLQNIRASVVHQLAAPLLLGQTAIEKLGKIQLEGNKLTIIGRENNFSNNLSQNTNQEFREVYSCSEILDIADEAKGKIIERACNGPVEIIYKTENFYRVRYGNVYGFMSSKWLK